MNSEDFPLKVKSAVFIIVVLYSFVNLALYPNVKIAPYHTFGTIVPYFCNNWLSFLLSTVLGAYIFSKAAEGLVKKDIKIRLYGAVLAFLAIALVWIGILFANATQGLVTLMLIALAMMIIGITLMKVADYKTLTNNAIKVATIYIPIIVAFSLFILILFLTGTCD